MIEGLWVESEKTLQLKVGWSNFSPARDYLGHLPQSVILSKIRRKFMKTYQALATYQAKVSGQQTRLNNSCTHFTEVRH